MTRLNLVLNLNFILQCKDNRNTKFLTFFIDNDLSVKITLHCVLPATQGLKMAKRQQPLTICNLHQTYSV